MSLLEIFNRQFGRLRSRYASSQLPKFFAWWGAGLIACLPERARALFAERADALLVEVEGRQLVLRRDSSAGKGELARLDPDTPLEDQRREVARVLATLETTALRTVFCVPAERVLRRELVLPVAAEDNLRQVLAFEMDRQTPFKAEQVYFDYAIAGRDSATRSLQVDLAVIPRALLDQQIAPLAPLGLTLDAVDCRANAGTGRAQLNLLPQAQRAKRKNLRLRINLGLVGLLLVLLLIVMGQSLANREAAVATMTEEVERASQEAKKVAALKRTLKETIESANFLALKKRDHPVMVDLIEDISKRLPDDTWLERISFSQNKLQLQGQSNEASKLIALIKGSKLVSNPSFEGVMQKDPRTQKDRFNLAADFKKAADAKKKEVASAPVAGG